MVYARTGKAWTLLALALTALLATLVPLGVAGCSRNQESPQLGGSVSDAAAGTCGHAAAGCACPTPGTTVSCQEWLERSGNYTTCRIGVMTCQNGVWGPCVDPGTLTTSTSTDSIGIATGGIRAQSGGISLSGIRTQSLGFNTSCGGPVDDGGEAGPGADPCDPTDNFDPDSGSYQGCNQISDTPDGLDAGPRFTVTEAGLTPLPDTVSEAGIACTGLAVTPPILNLTVTGFNPIATTPAMADFTASYTPAACDPSLANAAWSIDRTDLGAISNGVFTLVSGVAGPINVQAYAAGFMASAVVNVTTNVIDTSRVSTAVAQEFNGSGTRADSINWLYPYENTVFPRGVAAPVVQYDNLGVQADAVEVSIEYPATGTPTFTDSVVVPESTPPQVAIDPIGWGYFDQTAAGNDARIVIQRVVGGVLRNPITRIIHFGTAPLRGNIFYTQYDVGANTALIMSAQPGGTTPAQVAMPGASKTTCGVCHSVSANGTTLVTSNWGDPNTSVARVNQDGTLTGLASMRNQPKPPAQDSRGFAYSAITPDGQYALQGTNWWGNTVEPSSSNTIATAPHNDGSGLTGQYYTNTTQAGAPVVTETDPTVDFSWGGSSPVIGVPAGSSYSVVWSGYVQAIFSETYTFEVQSSDGVRLTVDGTTLINSLAAQPNTRLSGTIGMTAGQKVPITLTYLNVSGTAQVHLRWSSPSQPYEIIAETQLYPSASVPQTGLYGQYYDNVTNPIGAFPALGATPTAARVDATVAFAWNGASPIGGVAGTNFGARWTGNVTIPCSDTYTICISGDDGVRLWLDGTQIVNGWTYQGVTQYCATPKAYTGGSVHPVRMEYFQAGGGAAARFSWAASCVGSTTQVAVPSTYLTPSQTTAAPTNGLTATYYDSLDFSGPSSTEIDAVVDFDWGGTSPAANIGGTNWSAEWSGQVQIPCSGSYAFCVVGDDGVRLWVDGTLVDDGWKYQGPTSYCNSVLNGLGIDEIAGTMHDIKMDYFQGGGGSMAQLQWVSSCIDGQQDIPNADLFPTGDQGTGGYDIPFHSSGDLGTGYGYSILSLPKAINGPVVDVTGPNSWGLGTTAMMVPAFSPDGTKLVFVDGDTSGGAAWRQGLSFFNFDESARQFSGRTNILNTQKAGLVVRWPAVESDSRSVIYQTNPTSQDDMNSYPQYGGMLPSGYSTIPGQLYSIDMLSANPSPVSLDQVNAGLGGADSNHSYQPTMLPAAAGGYRWTVFTSDRQYGNTENVPGSGIAPTTQLWVGAIDDTTSATSDRSHPPFRLSNQALGAAADRIRNERAYWVLNACKPSLANLNPPSAATPPSFNWTDMDIGNVAHAGSAVPMGTSLAVTGGGDDIWGTADAFNFAYMPISGDFTFQARVTQIGNSDPWAKAGIMLRSSLNANAAFAHNMISAGGATGLQWRTPDGNVCSWASGPTITPLVPPTPGAPYWLRLVRSSGVVNAFVAPDNANMPGTWTNVGTVTPAIPDAAYIGLAVTAHNNSTTQTSIFDNIGFIAQIPTDPRPGSLCQDDTDCCGALTNPPTASCQVDVPIETQPLSHCLLLASSACIALGDPCVSDADCCGFPTNHCSSMGKCAVPPPPFPYRDTVFTRDYVGSCPATMVPVWRMFNWAAQTPGDSDIQLSVATAMAPGDLPATITSMGVVPLSKQPGTASYNGQYYYADVGDALKAGGQIVSGTYVRIYLDFQPSSDGTQVPTLQNWFIQYDCVAAE